MLFSFNNPHGACPACSGLGALRRIDPELVVAEPGSAPPAAFAGGVQRGVPGLDEIVAAVARHVGVRPDAPWSAWPAAARALLLEGAGDEPILGASGRGDRLTRPHPP